MAFRDFVIFNFEFDKSPFDKDSYFESSQHNKARFFL